MLSILPFQPKPGRKPRKAAPPPTPPMKTPNPQLNEAQACLQEAAAEVEEFKRAANGSITDMMADWVAAQYLMALRHELAAQPPGPARLKLLAQAASVSAALQRGSRAAAKLQLERQQFEFAQQKHKDALEAAKPKYQKYRDPKLPLSDEDRMAIIDKVDEIMGLK
jgi:hypothetical protein